MQICFVRHGQADWPEWEGADDERPLTDSGTREMERVASFLRRADLRAEAILASPLPRAAQTAEIVARQLDLRVVTKPAIAHGFDLKRLSRLTSAHEGECLIVVGHEPSFSTIIRELTGGRIKLAKGGVALVKIDRSCTGGELRWLFPPRITRAAPRP